MPDPDLLVSARNTRGKNTNQPNLTPITYSGEGTGVGSSSLGAAVEVAGVAVTFSDKLLLPAAGRKNM